MAEEIPVVGKEFSLVERDLSESLPPSTSGSEQYAKLLTLGELYELARPRRALLPIVAKSEELGDACYILGSKVCEM